MIKTEEQKSSLPKFNDIKSKVTDKSLEDILEYVYIRLLGDDKTAHHSLLSLYSEVYHLETMDLLAQDVMEKNMFPLTISISKKITSQLSYIMIQGSIHFWQVVKSIWD